MAVAAKLLIEVKAGVIPGKPIAEFTKRWTWTNVDQAEMVNSDISERAAAEYRYIQMAGESREYAASLENPKQLNWVRRDWVWL